MSRRDEVREYVSRHPVCPHCRQRIINPGGHAEACTGPGPQHELAPNHEIDPTTQVNRTPGIDAVCQKVGPEGYAPDCGFPFCDCFVRGGS